MSFTEWALTYLVAGAVGSLAIVVAAGGPDDSEDFTLCVFWGALVGVPMLAALAIYAAYWRFRPSRRPTAGGCE